MLKQINFVPGDTVRVYEKVKEEDKARTQAFEGVVLAIKGRGENKSFTVAKTVKGIGVEKIWPVNSVNLEKVVVKAHSKKKIRRAKLYYLRNAKST